jgi:methylated-DNA-[protein]-cysteine S-methyltransferase
MYTRHAVSVTEQIDDVIIVASDAAVVGIYFPHHWTKPDVTQFGDRVDLESDPVLAAAAG